MIYFERINIHKEEPNMDYVITWCDKCKKLNALDLDMFDELEDGDHVTLKDNITLKCNGCGEEHKERIIKYKKRNNYVSPRPKCPACGSIMLNKITTGKKIAAAAMIGAFAIPYTSKTYECMNCKYRF